MCWSPAVLLLMEIVETLGLWSRECKSLKEGPEGTIHSWFWPKLLS